MAKLVFVYNAESGIVNGIFDSFHKILKPSTYTCDLCVITHNHVGIRKAWGKQMESIVIDKIYLHRDSRRTAEPR